jgi:hypothetical protein
MATIEEARRLSQGTRVFWRPNGIINYASPDQDTALINDESLLEIEGEWRPPEGWELPKE